MSTRIYADTLYWVASVLPGDPWQGPSVRAASVLGDAQLVTTEEVLIETLSAFAGLGQHTRCLAVRLVRSIVSNPSVPVLPQSTTSFARGLALYEARADKTYSLVDCISMQTMRVLAISQVLTNDHHFAQEGFEVLIQR